MRFRAEWAALACLTVSAGCFFTSLDGFSGTADASDAGADSTANGSTDAVADGGADGAKASVRCADEADATLCSDFDDLVLGVGWDGIDVVAGSARQDDASATTPPFAFLSELYPDGGKFNREAYLARTFALAPKRLRIGFDIRLEDVVFESPDSEIALLVVSLGPGMGNYYAAQLSIAETGMFVWQQNFISSDPDDTGPNFPFSKIPALNVWSRIEITYDFSARTMSATLDGETVATGTLYATMYTTPFRLYLGQGAYDLAAHVQIRFDHFVLRID
jgi:hypothetical protein